MKNMLVCHKKPIYGGVLTALFTGLSVYLLGSLSGHEALQLLEATLPRISMLFNTIILASATILALQLTLLGISSGTESRLKKTHYRQVLSLARFDSFLFIATLEGEARQVTSDITCGAGQLVVRGGGAAG